MTRPYSAIILCCFAGALLAVSAFAQATGQLIGSVSDASHAAVPGAEVTATGIGTGLERKTTTNQQGDYTLPFLPPGEYRVRVQKEGFRQV